LLLLFFIFFRSNTVGGHNSTFAYADYTERPNEESIRTSSSHSLGSDLSQNEEKDSNSISQNFHENNPNKHELLLDSACSLVINNCLLLTFLLNYIFVGKLIDEK
jgi:hypothetical protein